MDPLSPDACQTRYIFWIKTALGHELFQTSCKGEVNFVVSCYNDHLEKSQILCGFF